MIGINTSIWLSSYSGAGSSASVGVSSLLQESGFNLLQENGDKILLEDGILDYALQFNGENNSMYIPLIT